MIENNHKKSFEILKSIPKWSILYQAQLILQADIYLNKFKQISQHNMLYKMIAIEKNKWELYGDKLMLTNEPNEAFQAYLVAFENQENNQELIFKIAQAVSDSYNYQMARVFFEKYLYSKNHSRIILIFYAEF